MFTRRDLPYDAMGDMPDIPAHPDDEAKRPTKSNAELALEGMAPGQFGSRGVTPSPVDPAGRVDAD